MFKNPIYTPNMMEFTTFKKKNNVTDDELMQAVLRFEEQFLSKQEGVVFHCLVRNLEGKYANVLFADSPETFNRIFKLANEDSSCQAFFNYTDAESVNMVLNTILKPDFSIPDAFSCVEFGTFDLNNTVSDDNLNQISNDIETQYLNRFENTKAHFIGKTDTTRYSEVTFGKTLAKTKEVCFNYPEHTSCNALLNIADLSSMDLDFWYVVG